MSWNWFDKDDFWKIISDNNCLCRDFIDLRQKLKTISSNDIDVMHERISKVVFDIEIGSFAEEDINDDWKNDFCLSRLYGFPYSKVHIESLRTRFDMFNQLLTEMDKKYARFYVRNTILSILVFLKNGEMSKIQSMKRKWWKDEYSLSHLVKSFSSRNRIIKKMNVSRFLSHITFTFNMLQYSEKPCNSNSVDIRKLIKSIKVY